MSSSEIFSTQKKDFIVINIGNYYNRIFYYKKVNKDFSSIYKQKCLIPIKKQNGVIEYLIENTKLVLIKKIGSNSKYGVIYLTIKAKNLYKFATKLTAVNYRNLNEIKIAQLLSEITLNDENPHFLLIYKTMICNNTKNEIYTSLPKIIKNNDYYISVNELVSGNLKNLILNSEINAKLAINILQQILLSILSFHYFTGGVYHNDCHYKNFLFQRIKSGGYFHYKIYDKNIYIKNFGYIWIIWDFGLAHTELYYKTKRLEDYIRIVRILNEKISINDDIYNESMMNILKYKYNYREIFGDSDKNFFEDLFKNTRLFQTYLPKGSKIINKKPYIIK